MLKTLNNGRAAGASYEAPAAIFMTPPYKSQLLYQKRDNSNGNIDIENKSAQEKNNERV